MNIATALVLGLEVGVLLFCAGAAIGWRVGDREVEREGRRALRLTAADCFYIQFLAYRLGHRRAVDVPLRFERPAYTSSRTWGDS
ncbi:hypothetical protein ABTY00_24150 [Streptomyces microflavus]|uniref:hypothetical protein n=1 Tax=Streptomyces microflavus TaxID=1919 RepID=UPI00332D5A11